MSAPPRPLLEVIALDAADARAAAAGGADRLEVVRAIETGGLTPAPEVVAAIRAAVALPLRVMLRPNGGFGATAAEVAALARAAAALRRAGADAFVLGFLTPGGALDRAALDPLIATIAPAPWTLHHAFDHAADPRAAWDLAANLPGCDQVLSGGRRGDLGAGLPALLARAGWQTDRLRWLAGGGLAPAHVPPLRAVGIAACHIGRAARPARDWSRPVDSAAVRHWRGLLDGMTGDGAAGCV